MADTFSECEREGEDVVKRKQREKERLEEKIVVLETYLKDLEGMNKKIEGKKIVGKEELEKLNLPTTDNEMITLRFNLPTKKYKKMRIILILLMLLILFLILFYF